MDKVERLRELQRQLTSELSTVEHGEAFRIAVAAAFWDGVEAAGGIRLDPAVWGELFDL